jgi:crossover junction endodeoxyribonuclease RuvC
MSDRVIGVDPGIAGALALVSLAGELIEVADMPVLRDGGLGDE